MKLLYPKTNRYIGSKPEKRSPSKGQQLDQQKTSQQQQQEKGGQWNNIFKLPREGNLELCTQQNSFKNESGMCLDKQKHWLIIKKSY